MTYSARIVSKFFLVLFFLLSFTVIVSEQNSSYATYCRRDTDCAAGEYCLSSNQCAALPVTSTPIPPSPTPPTGCSYRNPPCASGFTCDPVLVCNTPTPTSQICAQVMTPARNTTTRECQIFSSSCLPSGWVSDSSCQTAITPTPSPLVSSPTPSPLFCHTDANCPTTPLGTPPYICSNEMCQRAPVYSCALKADGDADCNDMIDLLDFNIWRTEFLTFSNSGPTAPTPTPPQADFNKDGTVNILDFNIWRDGFLTQPLPTIATSLSVTPTLGPASNAAGCITTSINCLSGRNYCLDGVNGQQCGVCENTGGVQRICISPTLPTHPVIVR